MTCEGTGAQTLMQPGFTFRGRGDHFHCDVLRADERPGFLLRLIRFTGDNVLQELLTFS